MRQCIRGSSCMLMGPLSMLHAGAARQDRDGGPGLGAVEHHGQLLCISCYASVAMHQLLCIGCGHYIRTRGKRRASRMIGILS